jgi:hypothetical protein
MVHALRPQTHARSIVEPQPSPRLLLLWNLQPLATPDPLYPVLAYLPAIALQQRRDPAVAIAAILTGKLDDGSGESIFVFALYWQIALRAPWLVDQSARSTLTNPMLSLSMIHRAAPSLGA